MTRKNTAKKQDTAQRTTTAPSHIVWFVPDRENAPWQRIGAMWPTKSAKGYRQVLDLVPIGQGGIVVLPYEPKNNAEAGA